MQSPRRNLLLVHRPGTARDERCAALVRIDLVAAVAVVSSRLELLAHLDATAPSTRPDLVVVAHDPPWIDGVDVVRMLDRMRDTDSGGRRDLVLLDADDATTAIDALRAGAAGVVGCPTGTAELVATVTSVVVGSCVVPRSTAGRLVSMAPRPQQEQLSARELEVLAALADGATNSEIAAALYVSRETVKTHVAHVLRKLGVGDRRAAVARGVALGLVPQPAFAAGAAGSTPTLADHPTRTPDEFRIAT